MLIKKLNLCTLLVIPIRLYNFHIACYIHISVGMVYSGSLLPKIEQ